MRAQEAKFECDISARTTYIQSGRVPPGWRSMKIWEESQEEPEASDTCDSCTSAILSAIATRKRAEKGRHISRPLYDVAPHEERANAIAATRLTNSFSSSGS